MKKGVRTALVWVLLVVVGVAAFQLSRGGEAEHLPATEISAFLADVEANRVSHVRLDGNRVIVTSREGDRYLALGVVDDDLLDRLSARGVQIDYGPEPEPSSFPFAFAVGAALVVVLLLFLYYVRRQGAAAGGILTLRNTRARELEQQSRVTFADIGGAAEAKEDLRDVIDALVHFDRWQKAGVRPPRGVLLVGPPGCGKTLLARAVAGEAKVPFLFVSASEFVEMFVGVGAARVRDTFEQAGKRAPAIVFIDELDAVGRRRGSGVGSAHDEREQTLNELLVALDGLGTHRKVVVIAATNRPDVLDKALLRPGRFDRQVSIPLPNASERLETLRIHTRDKTLAEAGLLQAVADRTEGATGALLEMVANEAALMALRRVRGEGVAACEVTAADFDAALHKVQRTERVFDRLDAILIESASQLAQPTGPVRVRVTLRGDAAVEGEMIWADGSFVKLAVGDAATPLILPKAQVLRIEALGATALPAGEVVVDAWAHRTSDVA